MEVVVLPEDEGRSFFANGCRGDGEREGNRLSAADYHPRALGMNQAYSCPIMANLEDSLSEKGSVCSIPESFDSKDTSSVKSCSISISEDAISLMSDDGISGKEQTVSKVVESSPSISDIGQILTCVACRQRYKDPKLLICFHSFCWKCIQSYREGESDFVICNYCRTCQPMPEGGPKMLSTSSTLTNLIELTSSVETRRRQCEACEKEENPNYLCTTCNVVICNPCRIAHANLKVTKNHTVMPLDIADQSPLSIFAGRRNVMCEEHDEAINFRCLTCGLFLCTTEASTFHSSHDLEVLAEVRQRLKRPLAELERKIKQSLLSSKSVETNARCRQDRFDRKFTQLEELIDSTLSSVLQALQESASSLKDCIRDRREMEHEKTSRVLQEAETRTEISLHLRKMLHAITNESCDMDALTFLSYCEQQFETSRKNSKSDLISESQMVFRPAAILRKVLMCPDVGSLIEIGNYPDFVQPRLLACFDTIANITSLTTTKYGEIICTSFQEKKCLMYGPTGHVIRNLSHNMVRPWDVAVTDDSCIVIADCGDTVGHGSVKMFSPAGCVMKVIAGHVNSPGGIAIDNRGRLLLCDDHEICLKIFSLNGEILGQIKISNKQYLFQGPLFVTVNVNNDIVISDDHRSIKIISPLGDLKGKYDVDDRHCLQGVCTDTQGQIFVADSLKQGIHILTASGRLRRFVPLEGLCDIGSIMSICLNPAEKLMIAGKNSKMAVIELFKENNTS